MGFKKRRLADDRRALFSHLSPKETSPCMLQSRVPVLVRLKYERGQWYKWVHDVHCCKRTACPFHSWSSSQRGRSASVAILRTPLDGFYYCETHRSASNILKAMIKISIALYFSGWTSFAAAHCAKVWTLHPETCQENVVGSRDQPDDRSSSNPKSMLRMF